MIAPCGLSQAHISTRGAAVGVTAYPAKCGDRRAR